MTLLSDIAGLLSVDRGRSSFALGLVDPFAYFVLFLVGGCRKRFLTALAGLVASAGCLDRPLYSCDEVAEELLRDQQPMLELGDGLRRGLEQDDVVRALTVAVDGIGQSRSGRRTSRWLVWCGR